MIEKFITHLLMIAILLCGGIANSLELTLSEDEELGEDVLYKAVIMNGIIEPDDSKKLSKLLEDQLKTGKRTIFLLTSPGGVLEEVADLAKVIVEHSKKSYEKLGKPDLFAINEECGSSCSILTSALTKLRDKESLEIFIHFESQFLFHRPSRVVEEDKDVDLKNKKNAESAFRKMIKAYVDFGVSVDWLDSNSTRFKSPKGLTVTAKSLCTTKSRVIPEDSCSKLDSDRFSELMLEVYEDNKALRDNKELRKSLIK